MLHWKAIVLRARRALRRQAVSRSAALRPTVEADAAREANARIVEIDSLLDVGALSAARIMAAAEAKRFPGKQYFRSVCTALDALPPPTGDVGFDAFVDDRARDVQIVRRHGATTVMFAFCANDRLTLPLNLIHRWIGAANTHVVYLRDRNARLYHRGVQSIGDLSATLARLQGIAAMLGAERIVCYGGSAGGHGCLLYAAHLGADAVLAFGAPTSVSAAGSAEMALATPDEGDLRMLYAAPNAPRAHLVFAAGWPRDRVHAERMVGLATVSIEAVPGARTHGVALDLIRLGRLAPLLQGLTNLGCRQKYWPRPGTI